MKEQRAAVPEAARDREPGLRWVIARSALVTALAVASVLVPKLALPAAFLTLVAYVSLPARPPHAARVTNRLRPLLGVAAVCAGIGSVRFVVGEAVPGIIQGGKDAAASSAISRLREIVFAEDAMRKLAHVDPDGDRIGSAALISDLSGVTVPAGAAPFTPILNERYRQILSTKAGTAARVGGYLYMVCLPVDAQRLSAEPRAPVDHELAERRFVAYAWPAEPTGRIESAFFIDEHERILVSKNLDGKDPRYVGPDFPPPCDAALRAGGDWQTWRDKKPRASLPGDSSKPKGSQQ